MAPPTVAPDDATRTKRAFRARAWETAQTVAVVVGDRLEFARRADMPDGLWARLARASSDKEE